jgi:putative transcriptional regulator
MSPRSLTVGNVIRRGPKRPHYAGNPLRDPFAKGGIRLGRVRGRGRRARDRVEFKPIDVRAIRALFGQTRGQFAEMMGICKETLRNWERGRRYPVGPSRALLRIAAANPDVVAAVLVRNRVRWGRVDFDD